METVFELAPGFAVGVALFTLGYRGFTGKWPWQRAA